MTLHPGFISAGAALTASLFCGAAWAQTGWQPHKVKQDDGQGGRISRPSQIQVLQKAEGRYIMPFGLVQMDNGEVVLICTWHNGEAEQPVIAFSQDDGATWSEFQTIPGATGRPMNLTYLGQGNLTFVANRRFFSSDYGRTWPESLDPQPTADGLPFEVEGNAWVDFDDQGKPVKIMEIGWHYEPGKKWPVDDATCVFRYSTDGGKTWQGEVSPPEWKFSLPYQGQPLLRGVSEGAIVRAANGWLVAALRTDMPPHFFDGPHDDSLEGTAISLSQDEGQTWSPLNILFTAGRHHANLSRLPNGDLVCVVIVRDDIQEGKLASHFRGCDAVISHDNGLTWDLAHKFTLDEWEYLDPNYWVNGQCGHVGSVVLKDGSILTAYGHYLKGAAVLVKWNPEAEPIRPTDGWDFKFKDFVIGAWLGPDGTEAEVQVYREAGFNVVMVGRYMAHGQYALPERVARELDLVHQFGLGAMIDTYTQNDKPWGGVVPPSEAPGHHPASLEELRWIHERFGQHPALIGYLIGDDQGTMSPQLQDCTRFLREKAPYLMPWICGWVPAQELAVHRNPFVNWQIYPTLYNLGDSAEQQARSYCSAYDRMRQDCQRYGLLPWPMFNACGQDVSDSLLRFPIYAALAYGAQGLWYFTYRTALNNGVEGQPGHDTYEAARADVKPNWYVAQKANHRVAAYGPRLLGCTSQGLFSTGWEVPGAAAPSPRRVVQDMSDNLLVGLLKKPGQPLLAMVVDKRVDKTPDAVPPRQVEAQFTDLVQRVTLLDATGEQVVEGNTVHLSLAGGEGLLLALEAIPGRQAELEQLASPEGNAL